MTTSLDLTLTRGDDRAMALVTGIDLAGALGVRFTARYRSDDTTAVFTKTLGAGIVVTDAVGGLATVTISHADWSAYTGRGALVYDVEVTTAAGKVSTVLKGGIAVLEDVSR